MNLPNKLTVLRVIMVPFFVFFMLTGVGGAANKWIALIIFCVASLTDMLDGKIARARNLVTNFGKLMKIENQPYYGFQYTQFRKVYGSAGR